MNKPLALLLVLASTMVACAAPIDGEEGPSADEPTRVALDDAPVTPQTNLQLAAGGAVNGAVDGSCSKTSCFSSCKIVRGHRICIETCNCALPQD